MNMRPASRLLTRYTRLERINHWITAITFVFLALSGLALFHPALFELSRLFGGGVWTRILHPFMGVMLFLSFLLLALRFWHHNLMCRNDWQWLRRILDVIRNREDGLPEVGRYNAGQKLLFWTMLVTIPALMASGVVIWRPWFAGNFGIDTIRIALLVHAVSAFVIISGIIVHIYAAIWIQGTMGAMLRGTVTRAWARKHHPGWFRRLPDGE